MGVFVNQESGTSCSDMARLCRKVVPFHILSLDPRANKCNQCAPNGIIQHTLHFHSTRKVQRTLEHQLGMPLISNNFQCVSSCHTCMLHVPKQLTGISELSSGVFIYMEFMDCKIKTRKEKYNLLHDR
jgi:hypothetical protein